MQEGSGTKELRWLRDAPQGIKARGLRTARLGVLSGTFNPPTRAHLALATEAMRQVRLDEVLFVLPEVPPHKNELAVSLADRAALLGLAVAPVPQFSAAIVADGLFLDIHRAVARHYPPCARMFFLVGRDAAERILQRWPYQDLRQALAEMFERFDFVVAARGGRLAVEPGSPLEAFADRMHRVELPPGLEGVSATLAREVLAAGRPAGELLPQGIEDLIRVRGLYGALAR